MSNIRQPSALRLLALLGCFSLTLVFSGCAAAPGAEQTEQRVEQPDGTAQIAQPDTTSPSSQDRKDVEGTQENPRNATPAPTPQLAETRAGKSAVMLKISDNPIHAREILDVIIQRHRKIFDQVVQDILIKRVLEMENASYDIQIPEKQLQADILKEVEKAEGYAQVQYQMSIAKLLQRQGRSIDQFKKAAREKIVYQLTLHRMVRFDQLRNGAVKVRHIVVKSPEKAELLLGKIRQGADFIKLAKQHSICPSRRVGGLLPMLTPGFLADPEVEKKVFKLREGQVSGIVQSKRGYHLFRALYRHQKSRKAYATLEPVVAASLERYPLIGDVEINYWLDKLRKKYPLEQHF